MREEALAQLKKAKELVTAAKESKKRDGERGWK